MEWTEFNKAANNNCDDFYQLLLSFRLGPASTGNVASLRLQAFDKRHLAKPIGKMLRVDCL